MKTLRAYFELVRLPNLFTAVADVVAGFAFAGGSTSQWQILLGLSASSVCLYAGGVTLNDVCDARIDAAERPERPIPAGRISILAAKRLAFLLLTLGIILSTSVSIPSGIVASTIVGCVLLYDAVLKRHAIAPAIMGMCRAMNFCLPLAALGVLSKGAGTILPVAVIWLYVTSLTYFARSEAVGNRRAPLAIGTLGVCLATTGLVGLHWTLRQPHDAFLPGVVVVVITLAFYGISAAKRPEPVSIQRAVHVFVLLLAGIDMCIAFASRGSGFAAGIGGLLVLAVVLGSKRARLPVT